MNGKETMKTALASTQQLMNWYVSDLSDDEIFQRPIPQANHIAWQVGHIIVGEMHLVKGEGFTASYPTLPPGFMEKYTNETSKKDGKENFHGKAELMDLFNKTRAATIALVDTLSDADFDKPSQGTLAKFAPRRGDFFLLLSNHILMHAGQFSVLRRKLGKPVLF
jgi:hypothetical protein